MLSSELGLRNLALTAAIAMLTVLLVPFQPLQAVAGLALALYLPGRAMLEGLLTARVSRTEEFALASGLSICVTILGGFILHFTGAMTTWGWALFLAAFTAVACGLAYLSGNRIAGEKRSTAMWHTLRLRDRAALVTAAFFCLLSFTIATAGVHRYPFFRYTELWIVPAPDSPRTALNLGVRNREGSGQSFVVELRTESQLLGRWSSVHLEPDETWSKAVPFSLEALSAGRVEVRLFKAEDPKRLYRRAWLSSFN